MSNGKQKKRDLLFKISTVGDGAVGKTAFLDQFVNKRFKEKYMTTLGLDVMTKTIKIDGVIVELSLWDFGGQERFEFLIEDLMKGSDGAFLMFDLSRIHTIHNIPKWMEYLYEKKEIPVMLIGSKNDLIDDGQYEIIEPVINQLCEDFNLKIYARTSAKTNENIDSAFEMLVKEIIRYKKENEKK